MPLLLTATMGVKPGRSGGVFVFTWTGLLQVVPPLPEVESATSSRPGEAGVLPDHVEPSGRGVDRGLGDDVPGPDPSPCSGR